MPSEQTWVIGHELIWVNFEDLDLVWLKFIWDDGGTTRADMIEILFSSSYA
jgi:hypothetical protein